MYMRLKKYLYAKRVNSQPYITMDSYKDKMLVNVLRMHKCTGVDFIKKKLNFKRKWLKSKFYHYYCTVVFVIIVFVILKINCLQTFKNVWNYRKYFNKRRI